MKSFCKATLNAMHQTGTADYLLISDVSDSETIGNSTAGCNKSHYTGHTCTVYNYSLCPPSLILHLLVPSNHVHVYLVMYTLMYSTYPLPPDSCRLLLLLTPQSESPLPVSLSSGAGYRRG